MLFGDRQLSGLLTDLRQLVYMPVAGLPSGMSSLSDLGVTTGGATSESSKESLAGRLTIDAEKLKKVLSEDPNGVRDLLAGVDNAGGWARRFEEVVAGAAKTDGTLDSRIDGADGELRGLQAQMTQMDARLALRERALQAQFTALEVALAKSQQQGQWLAGQLAALGNG